MSRRGPRRAPDRLPVVSLADEQASGHVATHDDGDLMGSRTAARDTPSAIWRADVAVYRRARIARLARTLRAAAEPWDGDPWDADQSSALDLAIDAEERLGQERRQ